MTSQNSVPPPLLTLRTAMVLFMSATVAIGAGALIFLSGQSIYGAVLGGLAAGAGAVKFFHSLLPPEKSR